MIWGCLWEKREWFSINYPENDSILRKTDSKSQFSRVFLSAKPCHYRTYSIIRIAGSCILRLHFLSVLCKITCFATNIEFSSCLLNVKSAISILGTGTTSVTRTTRLVDAGSPTCKTSGSGRLMATARKCGSAPSVFAQERLSLISSLPHLPG